MKKVMLVTFAVALLMSMMAIAQDSTKQDPAKPDTVTSEKTSTPAISLSGKVSDDGKTFVSDKDNKSYTVSNPDALKGHEGHRVILSANVNAEKNEINVRSVKMGKNDSMK
jgi:myo-inositol-hexaphosphate 3-phosphohydrolase